MNDVAADRIVLLPKRTWATCCIGPLLLAVCFLAGCATPGNIHDGVPAGAELQWPGPVDGPKIVWVKSIAGPKDAGIAKGFWQRTVEFFTGPDDRRILRPYGVLFSAAGRLYIADPGAGVVHCMDVREGRYTIIGDETGSPLRSPIGLTEDSQGRIYITDSVARAVFRHDPGDGSLKPVISAGLTRPTGIAWNVTTGLLYIVDTAAHGVVVTDLEGKVRFRFGSAGDGPAQFNSPTDIAVDRQGQIYVTDVLNARIRMFTAKGAQLTSFGIAGDAIGYLNRPKGVAVDSGQHVYVCDSLLDAVQIFDGSGRLLLAFGHQGAASGEFWMPSGIFIDREDYVYVADTYNQRIQVFRYVPGGGSGPQKKTDLK